MVFYQRVEGNGLRLTADHEVTLIEKCGDRNPTLHPDVIKIMSSKLDENGMYTVELRIRPLHSCYDFKGEGGKYRDLILWSSGRIWAMLWQVLGGIFPEKEELGVMPEK